MPRSTPFRLSPDTHSSLPYKRPSTTPSSNPNRTRSARTSASTSMSNPTATTPSASGSASASGLASTPLGRRSPPRPTVAVRKPVVRQRLRDGTVESGSSGSGGSGGRSRSGSVTGSTSVGRGEIPTGRSRRESLRSRSGSGSTSASANGMLPGATSTGRGDIPAGRSRREAGIVAEAGSGSAHALNRSGPRALSSHSNTRPDEEEDEEERDELAMAGTDFGYVRNSGRGRSIQGQGHNQDQGLGQIGSGSGPGAAQAAATASRGVMSLQNQDQDDDDSGDESENGSNNHDDPSRPISITPPPPVPEHAPSSPPSLSFPLAPPQLQFQLLPHHQQQRNPSPSPSPPRGVGLDADRILRELMEEEEKSDDEDDDDIVFVGMNTDRQHHQHLGREEVGQGEEVGPARDGDVDMDMDVDVDGDSDGDSDIVLVEDPEEIRMLRGLEGNVGRVAQAGRGSRAGSAQGRVDRRDSLFGSGSGSSDGEAAGMEGGAVQTVVGNQNYQPLTPPSTNPTPTANTLMNNNNAAQPALRPLHATTSTESIIPLSSPPSSPPPSKKRKLDKGKGRATEEDLRRIEREEMEEVGEGEGKIANGGGEEYKEGDLLSSYQCPICLAPPTEAVLTSCGHIMCAACLFSTLKSQNIREGRPPEKAGQFPQQGVGIKNFNSATRRNKKEMKEYYARFGADENGRIKGRILLGTCPVCRNYLEGGMSTHPGEGGTIYLEVCTVTTV